GPQDRTRSSTWGRARVARCADLVERAAAAGAALRPAGADRGDCPDPRRSAGVLPLARPHPPRPPRRGARAPRRGMVAPPARRDRRRRRARLLPRRGRHRREILALPRRPLRRRRAPEMVAAWAGIIVPLLLVSLPFMGRVAERSEVGWGSPTRQRSAPVSCASR